jgi:RecA-family ATPase
MAKPIDLDAKRIARPSPFEVLDIGDLDQGDVPKRDWLIPSVLIRRSITLFAGDGGVGKSLMCQQLQVAAALGIDWLGLPIPQPITSFGYYCEDDREELHRRFAAICEHYGCRFTDIAGQVLFACRLGEKENELVRFSGKSEFGKPEKTETFGQVATIVKEYGVQLTILDTISDIFAGNENVRYQVKTFVSMLRGLSLINNGGVLLTSHPSKSAMVDGSGFSGSTAWNGAVRNRLYLTAKRKKDDEGDDAPSDERTLRFMKSNYSPFGQKVRCTWRDGVFTLLPAAQAGSIVDKLEAKAKLMQAARALVEEGTFCIAGDNTRASLTVLARLRPECETISYPLLRRAQDELVKENTLTVIEMGPRSKRRKYIRPTDMLYPGELL